MNQDVIYGATEIVDGIEWRYSVSNGKVTTGGFNVFFSAISSSTSGSIRIPLTLGGYPVTSIECGAFEDCSALTSVVIPSSVTSIESAAFSGCSNLKIVVDDGNPNYISQDGALFNKEMTMLIRAPGATASYAIPSSVTSIGSRAFSGCSGLKSVVIPSSVTMIGDWAFHGCWDLTSVTIPEGVTSIGKYAFSDCMDLTSLEIPSSVTSIESAAFSGCSALKIVVDESNPNYTSRDGSLFNKEMTTLIRGPGGVASYKIPLSVTSIGKSAFSDCSALTSLEIPSSVTSIEDAAFSGCSNLESIAIPSSVTSIEDDAFRGCSSLKSVVIPSSVTSIEDDAFSGCSELYKDAKGVQYESSAKRVLIDVPESITGEFVIPNTVRFIYTAAFSGCSGLKSVAIPPSVTSIGPDAFDDCSSLKDVHIFNLAAWCAIKFDGYYSNPLHYAKKLYLNGELITDLVISEDVTSIGISAFSGYSGLKSVAIPSSVTSIEDYAFSGCSGLRSVAIPSSVTSIKDWVFSGCSGLKSVMIPSSVTSIGYAAFKGCSGLKSVMIPSSVTSIEDYAFSGCSGLKSVVIPSSVTSIKEDAFSGCTSLKSVMIPSSVTSIGYAAFKGCSKLKSVAIPSSVTLIEGDAFSGCTGLILVEIPSSVTSIGYAAFENCSKLKIVVDEGNSNYTSQDGALLNNEMTALIRGPGGVASYKIPSSVISIEGYAFSGCVDLTSITIPSSVTSIGRDAFDACWDLEEVHVSNLAAWCAIDFYGNSSNPLCYARNLYLNGELVTDLGIPSSVTSIGEYAFFGCVGLASVVIPEGVTSIGNYAFRGCSSLTSVTIPEGVTSIGRGAFSRCWGLELVKFRGVPPSATCDSFDDVTATGMYLPKHASLWEEEIDSNGKWRGLKMEMALLKVVLTAVGNGTVSGDGKYAEGESVKVTAVADEGWVFCGWNAEPAVMTPEYTFKMPDKAVKLTAYFAPAAAVSQAIKHHLTEHDRE